MSDTKETATPEPAYGLNEQGEVQFDNVDSLDTFAEACRIAEHEKVRKGRIVIDASRYVFLPFYRLKNRLLMRIMLGRNSGRLDVRLMTEHFTGMLNVLLEGRTLPENICGELLENHLESPLRIWCERLIEFRRIVKLESTIEQVLLKTSAALMSRRGLAYAASATFLWPRWLLNKINMVMLRFQIDLAIFLVGFFVTRRRNLVEIAWEINGSRLVLEAANNARIPRYLADVAAQRADLARYTVSEPAKLGDVHMDIQRQNKPLSEHHLSGAGLGILMVASAALRLGGALTPPRYNPKRGKTVAVFTVELDRLPAPSGSGSS
ncbi:hypothetical protein ACFL01_03500 [Planctomycetota bacterium]